MKKILDIITQLKEQPSLNSKMQILEDNKDNELLKNILNFAFNPYILTGISRKKFAKNVDNCFAALPQDITGLMHYLKNNCSGRDMDIYICKQFIKHLPENQQLLVEEIVTKTLNIGMGTTLLNKVYGKTFIPEFKVMLAHKYYDNMDRLSDQFIITRKLDGIRCLLFKQGGEVSLFTRQGIQIFGLEQIEKEALFLTDGYVYDGELLLANKGSKSSADHYRATVKVVRKDGIKSGVEFHIFDQLPISAFYEGKYSIQALVRKNELRQELDEDFTYLKEVPMLYVGRDKSQIDIWLNRMIAEGEEGIMLNSADAPYECKRSFGILKVKKFYDADVRVIEIHEGEGEIKGMLGAVTIEFIYKDENYLCRCGSGFSLEQRKNFFMDPEEIVGKIIQIGYFEITKNQEGGVGLRFPTFKEVRIDKDDISMN